MDAETIRTLIEVGSGLTANVVLLAWIISERKRFDVIFVALLEDWKRQRDRETSPD